MQDVRDKPVVAPYFPSSHPPTLAFYTSLIAMHLASVGQEMGQCLGFFVTWYDHLLLMERSIFDTSPCDLPPFRGTCAEVDRGQQFGGKGDHLRADKLCGKQAEIKLFGDKSLHKWVLLFKSISLASSPV